MIISVPISDLPIVWPKVRDMLHQGFVKMHMDDCYTMEWVFEQIESMQKQLWLATDGSGIKAAFVTSVEEFPTGTKGVNVFLAGGTNLDKWLSEAAETLTVFGRQNGCTRLNGGGRPGWMRKIQALKGDKFTAQYRYQLEI